MVSAVCQGLLSCRRHIGKREDPGDEVAPKPDADLRMPVDLPLDKKTVENQDWATGPPGNGPRAVGRGPLGLRAAGPLGRRGPWAAGRWAAGLLLAKPQLSAGTLHMHVRLHGNKRDLQHTRKKR